MLKYNSLFLTVLFTLLSFLAQTQETFIKQLELGSNSISITFEAEFEGVVECYHNNQRVESKQIATASGVGFTQLEPATVYDLVFDYNDPNGIPTTFTKRIITKSLSSGEIRIYFNVDTDESFSNGPIATGETPGRLEKAIIDLIDDAEYTIDMCSYNTNTQSVVNALIDAHNRGVRVRLIVDIEQNNVGLQTGIPFPVLRGSVGQGIMHNKFIIADKDHADQAWVQTGSTNYTFFQMSEDPNHIIMIQDQALAEVYHIEFEEMWGGDGDDPDLIAARFGDSKTDNTPHELNINGIEFRSYFSPSDNVAQEIIKEIDKAEHEVDIGLLLFTRWEIADAVEAAHRRGVNIKLIIEDEDSSERVIEQLERAGINLYLDNSSSLIYHHKYAIIDEGFGDATTITGSKNWTFSGDTWNDENTLIIKDNDIANIFRQEFQARWKGVATSLNEQVFETPTLDYSIMGNDIIIDNTHQAYDKLMLLDVTGRILEASISNQGIVTFNTQNIGLYLIAAEKNNQIQIEKVFVGQ